MAELNPIIHQPVRLRIMSALISLEDDSQMDFKTLGKMLDLTDGNLGSHLETLHKAELIEVEKIFQDRKPRTLVRLTKKGNFSFGEHVAALQEIIKKV